MKVESLAVPARYVVSPSQNMFPPQAFVAILSGYLGFIEHLGQFILIVLRLYQLPVFFSSHSL